MIHRTSVAIALIVSVLSVHLAAADITSDFSVNDDGWRIVDLTIPANPVTPTTEIGAPIRQTVGGNPSGYIEFTDPSDLSFFFEAPAKFLGNRSLSYGSVLQFDQFTTPNTPEWRVDPDVILVSGTEALVFQLPANPGTAWTSRSVPLNENGFHKGTLQGAVPTQAEFQAVLSSLTALRIRGEFVAGVVERTGLDNVVLVEVPEPATGIAALAVVVSMPHLRRRFTRRP